jgi:hypothetical protein
MSPSKIEPSTPSQPTARSRPRTSTIPTEPAPTRARGGTNRASADPAKAPALVASWTTDANGRPFCSWSQPPAR